MRISLVLIGLISFASCHTPENKPTFSSGPSAVSLTYVHDSLLNIHPANNRKYLQAQLFTGISYILDPANGDTLLAEQYRDGLQDGLSRTWYKRGNIREIRNYRQGKKEGIQKAFYENGHKKFLFTARSDLYEGVLWEWDFLGRKWHLGTYRNGQEEGPQKMWYDNGRIKANYVMRKGKRYGLLGTKNCRNVSDSLFAGM